MKRARPLTTWASKVANAVLSVFTHAREWSGTHSLARRVLAVLLSSVQPRAPPGSLLININARSQAPSFALSVLIGG